MTMLISAHLGDSLLIAGDKRAMCCDVETGRMRHFHDNEKKVREWTLGAIAGTGEKVFIDRVTQYFTDFKVADKKLKQMDVIYEEIETRLLESVPKDMLINNTFIFSMFDGKNTGLYSLPIEPFFQEFDREDGIKIIRPRLHEIKPWTVNVTCFNLPPDMSSLQNFQRHLKSLCDFENELFFIDYYVKELKQVFSLHASIDPSITTSFDVYFQRCIDGHSITLQIENKAFCSSVQKELNYWDNF